MNKPKKNVSDNAKPPRVDEESYREFERKMRLFEEGPTTTTFEQLIAAGIQLPEPDAMADADIRTKVWEVLAGLATLRVFLDQTDHLTDRELYAKLWHDVLREEVPAIDEIGFNSHVDLAMSSDDGHSNLYLKYYADEKAREWWRKDFPDVVIPPHEEPPFNRDWLVPRPDYELGPDAAEWLRANWTASAFATNRFRITNEAVEFVQQLYAAGAMTVRVANIMFLPAHNWAPYADTLIVTLPEDAARRRDLFDVMEHVGKPDQSAGEELVDSGQASIRLWWD